MTVLVSVVKQMMANGQPGAGQWPAASTGRHLGALAAYAAAAGIPAIIFLPKTR
jgi:threonine synthase